MRAVEFDRLIGFFANTLVMRVRLEGNPTFSRAARPVRATAFEALDHQDVPFEHVVEAVRPPRDLGINPLAQVNFRVRVEPPATLDLEEATATHLPVDTGFAAFDLALDLHVHDEGIGGEFIYNTRLFDRTAAERIAGDFEVLLRQVLDAPETRLLGPELSTDAAVPRAPSPRLVARRSRRASER